MNDRKSDSQRMDRALGRDFMASLVVFLVALPLCMGIALASGAPVAAGLVTGMIGGIIVGVLAGSPLQVSGPAAGLTVVCAEIIHQHGLPALGIVVLLAGLVQLVAGAFGLGQWFRAVSPAVVHGMLSGIGVLILSSQLHVMVDDKPRHGGLANLVSIPEAIRKGLPMPKQEDASLKKTRLALLKSVGQLHERQGEIAAHVARFASPHHQEKQSAAPQPDLLKPFVAQQQSILDDFASVRERVIDAHVDRLSQDDSPDPPTAVMQARRSMNAALADLASNDPEKASRSQAEAHEALGQVLAGLKSHDWAAKVGLVTIAIIILWQLLAPTRLRFIPGPLLAVAAATILAWAGALPVLYVEVPDRLVDGLTFPTWRVFGDIPLRELILAVATMAVISSAETLLCATAVDRMHTGPRTNYDRELMAQGVGNTLCGLLGALPMTGVIVRSAANVQAGARTRLSAIMHGLWLLLFVLLFGALLRQIPTAALAGVLVYTGFRLIDFLGLAHLWKSDRFEAIIFLATVTLIVVEDLLIGVAAGLVLAAIKLLWKFSYLDVRTATDTSGVCTVRIAGAATFLRLPILAGRLEEIDGGSPVELDVDRLTYIDQACFDLITSWSKQREADGIPVTLDRPRLEQLLRGGSSRPVTAPEGHVVATQRDEREVVAAGRDY